MPTDQSRSAGAAQVSRGGDTTRLQPVTAAISTRRYEQMMRDAYGDHGPDSQKRARDQIEAKNEARAKREAQQSRERLVIELTNLANRADDA